VRDHAAMLQSLAGEIAGRVCELGYGETALMQLRRDGSVLLREAA